MEVDVPQDEGVSREDVAEYDDDNDDAMEEAKRLLRFKMVEGDEETPSSSALPHDVAIDQRVVDL